MCPFIELLLFLTVVQTSISLLVFVEPVLSIFLANLYLLLILSPTAASIFAFLIALYYASTMDYSMATDYELIPMDETIDYSIEEDPVNEEEEDVIEEEEEEEEPVNEDKIEEERTDIAECARKTMESTNQILSDNLTKASPEHKQAINSMFRMMSATFDRVLRDIDDEIEQRGSKNCFGGSKLKTKYY